MAQIYNLYDEEYHEENISHEEYAHAKDHLTGLLKDIYETGCIEDLEFHLDEICHVFGLRLPKKLPLLTKKQQQESTQNNKILEDWVGLTRTYASSILCNK
jgi:hypothetical protein